MMEMMEEHWLLPSSTWHGMRLSPGHVTPISDSVIAYLLR